MMVGRVEITDQYSGEAPAPDLIGGIAQGLSNDLLARLRRRK